MNDPLSCPTPGMLPQQYAQREPVPLLSQVLAPVWPGPMESATAADLHGSSQLRV